MSDFPTTHPDPSQAPPAGTVPGPVLHAPGPTVEDAMQAAAPAPAPKPAAPKVKLGGTDKAAILLVTLGEERAAKILSFMDPDEAEPLVIRVAQLQNVPPEYVQVVMSEVVETAIARGYFYEGGITYARNLLNAAFGPERAEQLLSRLQTVIEPTPFRFLARTPPEQIYSFMRREHPQIIAVVLAHLPDSQSAQVLQQFTPDLKAEVLHRIAIMGQISPELLNEVEAAIRARMHNMLGSQTTRVGGVEAAAQLINRVDRQTERDIFERLTEADQPLAEELRQLLFVFEDIAGLEPRTIQQILQHADQKDLVLALRGANQEVRDKLMSNMSERAAENVREEIEIMTPRPRREVEEAQQRIVAVARRLEEQDIIQIFRGGDADELV